MNRGAMGVNSLPKTVTRQRSECDLNRGPSAPESSTLITRDEGMHTAMFARASAYKQKRLLYPAAVGGGALSDTAIRLSVCPVTQLPQAIGTLAACSLAVSRLRTRPRTDVHTAHVYPSRVETNCHRRGHIVSPPPGRHLV